jgi:hypothetical protein
MMKRKKRDRQKNLPSVLKLATPFSFFPLQLIVSEANYVLKISLYRKLKNL